MAACVSWLGLSLVFYILFGEPININKYYI